MPRLIDAVWLGASQLRLNALDALGRIGSEARTAVHSLVCLLKVSDGATRKLVMAALLRIAPDVFKNLPTEFGARRPSPPEAPVSKRHAAWKRSIVAAQARRETEALIRAQIKRLREEGFFTEERDVECVRAALAAKGHVVEGMQVVIPLFQLAAEGQLCRRRDERSEWAYWVARD